MQIATYNKDRSVTPGGGGFGPVKKCSSFVLLAVSHFILCSPQVPYTGTVASACVFFFCDCSSIPTISSCMREECSQFDPAKHR
jgi:hypothetical protein